MDLTSCDETGKPWNFDLPEQREKCKRKLRSEKPWLLIGSPMCTAFSILQGLNRKRMGEAKWRALWDHGMRHLLFAIELYDEQLAAGRYVLHEHPMSASSWHVPEMINLMAEYNLIKMRAICAGLEW